MKSQSEEWWARARRARDRLAGQVTDHADVSLVDIGLHGSSSTPVLRVHVRGEEPPRLSIPESVEGIPVRVVRGEYRPE